MNKCQVYRLDGSRFIIVCGSYYSSLSLDVIMRFSAGSLLKFAVHIQHELASTRACRRA